MARRGSSTEFKAQIGDWAKRFPEKIDALARQSVQEVCLRAVTNTPVDTGFLRGSWQPSIGKPYTGEPVQGDATAKIALSVADLRAGDKFYMRNNAVYAKRIEWGFVGHDSLGRYYNQKGRFMVTDAVKAWPTIVAGVARELTK